VHVVLNVLITRIVRVGEGEKNFFQTLHIDIQSSPFQNLTMAINTLKNFYRSQGQSVKILSIRDLNADFSSTGDKLG
jgi:hypothetical protein